MTNAYGWVERNGGIDVERDYPYAARYTTNAGMCNVLHAGRKEVTIDGFRSGMPPTRRQAVNLAGLATA